MDNSTVRKRPKKLAVEEASRWSHLLLHRPFGPEGPESLSSKYTSNLLSVSAYRTNAKFHHRKVEEFCKLIPDSAVVSAQQFLAPRLFKKKGILVFPKLEGLNGTIKADYVFIDKTNNGLYKNSPAYIIQPEFSLVEENKDTWKLIKSEGGYFLYERIGTYVTDSRRMFTEKSNQTFGSLNEQGERDDSERQ